MKPLLIILFVVMMQAIAPAAFGGALGSNVVAQASNSLVTLRALITPENYSLLGFHTVDEPLQASNAEPVQVYAVRLDQLYNYHAGQTFNSLLESDPLQNPASRVIVPVMVGTNVRSSISL